MSEICPCGSNVEFDQCCGPLLAGQPASSPEALMRSRYTAFAKTDIDYLASTLAPEALEGFSREDSQSWAEQAQWLGLEVRKAEGDQVEFVARFRLNGKAHIHHELASFRQVDGVWKYVDGVQDPKPPQRVAKAVGRNDPCPCGSGKKFKKCCGA